MKFSYLFKDIPNEALAFSGGKGSSLCAMSAAGLPVPNGFVILSTAFKNNELKEEAIQDIHLSLDQLPDQIFAVRSSALSEDSIRTSFAGEFESVLDVTRADVFSAIKSVAASAQSERVTAYSKVHGISQGHQIAVVVQQMVTADMSGVLFSADPITGSHVHMVGNFVYGAGEQLVSGEKNAYPFTITRIGGKYQGDYSFSSYAKSLYKAAQKAETIFGNKLDIEWVIKDKKLYIVQARPITTLQTIHYDTYEINQSLDTDVLWSSNNVGEAVPDVMSPFTWSLLHQMDLECQKIPGFFMFGNICGRTYANISVMISALKLFGYSIPKSKELIGDIFGKIPDPIEIPIYPFQISHMIPEMVIRAKKSIKRMQNTKKEKDFYLRYTPIWYTETLERIELANTSQELLRLWEKEVTPFLSALWNIWFGGAGSATLATFRKKLTKMVGEELANLLCSNFSSVQTLVSMQPVLAIEQIINGSLTREKYLELYGHRGPHEFEVYYEYPADDPDYIDKQIREYKNANLNPEKLQKKQQQEFAKAKEIFVKQYPTKGKWLDDKLEALSMDANTRESLRNEFVKVFRVMRHLLLKIGSITKIGDDIFMMYCFEIPDFLKGNQQMLCNLEKRRENFEKYREMPVFPQLIRGRFNPDEWIHSPNRRQDYYDPYVVDQTSDENSIKGFAGAPGVVEGRVHILHSFEEATNFVQGEILVTTSTNIGWTPLFPKATAIITDLGAPLSHAAIVARELGIPAVVGCGSATTQLKTGDVVSVNGGTGMVTLKI